MSDRPAEVIEPTEGPPPEEVRGNPRLFILFRIFFNCRFYYPVYAIMFLDFGLTPEQFAYLNVAWAAAIVLFEVPSGALADQFGRRTLLIAAAILMVLEMLVLLLMPVVQAGDHLDQPESLNAALWVLFLVFLLNRIFSGAAEAAASGADEALAYDSLEPSTREETWSALTSRLMKWQSIAFIFVTLVGAAVYDPEWVNRVLTWTGSDWRVTQAETLKFPVYLTLGMALATLVITLRMREPASMRHPSETLTLRAAVKLSYKRTLSAGAWILRTPAPLLLISLGFVFDSIVRLYYTIGSIYLRLLQYEERHFGVISVAGSLIGILAAWLAARLIQRFSADTNFRLVTALILLGLLGLAFPLPYYGVALLIPFWLAMRLLHYFLSNYLNRVIDSAHRATVLSFRGLSMNIAYGTMMMLYGLQTWYLRERVDGSETELAGEALDERIFSEAISTWWIYFLAVCLALVAFRRLRYHQSLQGLIDHARDELGKDRTAG